VKTFSANKEIDMTKHPGTSNYQGSPIAFTPAFLRNLEERLTVAEKFGVDEISIEGQTLMMSYGKLWAAAIRQKFEDVYGRDYLESFIGPEPKFTQTLRQDDINLVSRLSQVARGDR